MPKQKQQDLPGAEAPHIEEIEKAAGEYVDVRDRRMALTKEEVTAKAVLMKAVLEHQDQLEPDEDGTRRYRFDDLVVILKPGKPNVRVRTDTAEEEEDEEEE